MGQAKRKVILNPVSRTNASDLENMVLPGSLDNRHQDAPHPRLFPAIIIRRW